MVEILVSLEAISLVVLTVMVARLLREVGSLRDELRRQSRDEGPVREETHTRAPSSPASPGSPSELQPRPHRPSRPGARTAAMAQQAPPTRGGRPPAPNDLTPQGPRPPQGAMEFRTVAATNASGARSGSPNPTPVTATTDGTPRADEGFERIVGGHVLGILAALLVFFGLVFLAALIVPALTDEVRCGAMFVLSAALTVAGLLVTRHGKTAFSQALLGCGIGSVFVSILLAHALFKIIGNLPAIALMLAWLIACTLLAGRQRSPLLFVLVQLGMAISTCFAYSRGIDAQSLPVLLTYQLLATSIVVAGCMRALGRARTSGAFSGMAVSILASLQVLGVPHHLGSSDLPSFAVVMAAQYLLVTCLALVVCVGARRSEDRSAGAVMAEHVGAEMFWVAAVCLDACGASVRVIGSTGVAHPITWATIISLACVIAHWIVRLAAERSGRLDSPLAFASIHICAALCAGLLLWRSTGTHPMGATFISPVAVALGASGAITRDRRLREAAVAYLALDAAFMAAWGYASLNASLGAPVAILYLALLDALYALWWRMLSDERRESTRGMALLCGVVASELSLGPALGFYGTQFATVAGCACAASVVLALALADLSSRLRLSRALSTAFIANEVAIVAACCVLVVLPGPHAFLGGTSVEPALAAYTTLATVGIAVTRVARVMERRSEAPAWQQVVAGIMLTAALACAASGIASSGMLFVTTLAAMFAAFCCILCGFVRRLGALRLYGLVATLLCVLKIVTLDVGGSDPIGRVIAFILGGIACFGISALYTYALRRIS